MDGSDFLAAPNEEKHETEETGGEQDIEDVRHRVGLVAGKVLGLFPEIERLLAGAEIE
jgi:hypothetical protein